MFGYYISNKIEKYLYGYIFIWGIYYNRADQPEWLKYEEEIKKKNIKNIESLQNGKIENLRN